MFTQAEKTVVSTTLVGNRVKEQKIVRDGQLWRAYLLVEYPIRAANQALVQLIQNNNQLYTRFRATQTFKELQDEINKYDNSKQTRQN